MFRLPPKERAGYAALALATLFGVGFYGAKAAKPPPKLTFEEAPVPSATAPKVEPESKTTTPEKSPRAEQPAPNGASNHFRSHPKRSPSDPPVSLSKATADDLMSIPGIGPVTAQAIIDYRTQNGAFKEVDELIAIRGIGAKKLERVRPYLTP